MQIKCPECGQRMTIEEDLGGTIGTSLCPDCRAFFDSEINRLEDEHASLKQDSYIVEWQIGE